MKVRNSNKLLQPINFPIQIFKFVTKITSFYHIQHFLISNSKSHDTTKTTSGSMDIFWVFSKSAQRYLEKGGFDETCTIFKYKSYF